MHQFEVRSPAEQVANHLRSGILGGVWFNQMPGAPTLANEIGVDPKTILAALSILEKQGLLLTQGVGRRRRILLPEGTMTKEASLLRIGILLNEPSTRTVDYVKELQYLLEDVGHQPFFSGKSIQDLSQNLPKLEKLVEEEKADAWIIIGGSYEIVEWFSGQSVPAFALFGRHTGLPIAATRPEKIPAYQQAVDRLVTLGHRRIVLIARSVRRLPNPGRTEKAFLEQLQRHGIETGSYHLPDWQEDRKGFQLLLENLFHVTPPTALIIQESFVFFAARQFLAENGLKVPADVSMICTDDDRSFAWWTPSVSRICWDPKPVIRRVVKWAGNVGKGKDDRRQTLTPAYFDEGGTIGPVKRHFS